MWYKMKCPELKGMPVKVQGELGDDGEYCMGKVRMNMKQKGEKRQVELCVHKKL